MTTVPFSKAIVLYIVFLVIMCVIVFLVITGCSMQCSPYIYIQLQSLKWPSMINWNILSKLVLHIPHEAFTMGNLATLNKWSFSLAIHAPLDFAFKGSYYYQAYTCSSMLPASPWYVRLDWLARQSPSLGPGAIQSLNFSKADRHYQLSVQGFSRQLPIIIYITLLVEGNTGDCDNYIILCCM